MVGDDAVDLFGHRPVAAAEPRLDVSDSYAAAPGRGGAREGRADVSGHDDEVGLELRECLLELRKGRLSRACLQLHVRPRQRQLREEHVLQQGVVVLAGVDKALLDVPTLLECGVDGSDLHVVRPCAHDVDDERSCHQRSTSSSGVRA
jgi:hypothetical protein